MKFIKVNNPIEINIGRGDRVRILDYEYILAQVNGTTLKNEMCLINLTTGNRYANPVIVEDVNKLTDGEIHSIFIGDESEFVLVKNGEKFKIY